MNLDFHYYGTYLAAVLAGYDSGEAGVIAYAAQFVDEGEEKNLERLKSQAAHYVETCQRLSSVVTSPRPDIWLPFHFLPGLNAEYALDHQANFVEIPQNELEFLCAPDSFFVKQMMKNTKEANEREPNRTKVLIRTGMVMHILADTYAHQGFAGYVTQRLNGIKNGFLYDYTDQSRIFFKCPPIERFELGHGRASHCPDYGYMRFYYQPDWSNVNMGRDNTLIFTEAFLEMVYYLGYFNNRFITHANMDYRTISNCISPAITYENTDQSEEWKKVIQGCNIETLPNFEKEDWINAADKVLAFMECAHEHKIFVEQYVRFNNPTDIPTTIRRLDAAQIENLKQTFC